MITTKQRGFLRGLANKLEPVVLIGKGQVTEEVVESVDQVLEKRELIKVKIQENAYQENAYLDTKETAQKIAALLDADIVQCIGSKFVLYRKSKTNSKNLI